MEEILSVAKSVTTNLRLYGNDIGNTVENRWTMTSCTLNRNEMAAEEESCIKYYNSMKLKYNWDEKFEREENHYKQLEYTLKHKLEELRFFHGQDIDSRRWIIFSTDCISTIHLLPRGNSIQAFVYIRSSDVLNLLPMDILNVGKIIFSAMDFATGKKTEKIRMFIAIGSAHMYKEDMINNFGEEKIVMFSKSDNKIRNNE